MTKIIQGKASKVTANKSLLQKRKSNSCNLISNQYRKIKNKTRSVECCIFNSYVNE